MQVPQNAALVLVDVQHAIDDPSWGRRNNPSAEANVARLLRQWRDAQRPLVHVKHVSREARSTFRPGQRGVEFKEIASPREGETVVVKSTPSAFAGTPLEAWLRERGVDAIVVVGFITNNSVETTVRVAATLGFRVWVVRDATATFDAVDEDGRSWRAEDVHARSLGNLRGEYATIVSTDELLGSGAPEGRAVAGEAHPSLEPADEAVRGALTRLVADAGHAPTLGGLARAVGRTPAEVEASLRRLHEAHALLLHPGSTRPWVVHPFALAPGSCWVQTRERGYWANCLYCALGIAAAIRSDAIVTTRLGGEGETARFEVAGGKLATTGGVFHLSTPVARWWDNVIFACSSFQPFRNEADVDAWCARHDMPKGAVLPLEQLWSFASDWYGPYLQTPWRRRTPADARALFARHGLTGSFWSVP